jgi:hypothetical protein
MNHVLKLIRIEDVVRKTTLAKSTIWLKISQGDFIRPTRIGDLDGTQFKNGGVPGGWGSVSRKMYWVPQ